MPDGQDDSDVRNRASSTAFSRRGEHHQGGDSPQIHQLAGLDAEVPIQTELDAALSAAAAPQTEPEDGWYDRPSSMPDGLRRTGAGRNVVAQSVSGQNAVGRFALGQVALSRIGRDRFRRLPGGGGSLQLLVAPGAKAGHFQIASSAEIRVAAKTEAVRQQAEHLADDRAWLGA